MKKRKRCRLPDGYIMYATIRLRPTYKDGDETTDVERIKG